MNVSKLRWLRLAILVSCAVATVVVASCQKTERKSPEGTSTKGNSQIPAIDVRGGVIDSEVQPGTRVASQGIGGNGGSVRITSSSGDIDIRNTAPTTLPNTPTFVGAFPLDVPPGAEIDLGGSWIVDYVNVPESSTIRLRANTFLVVLGDVEIAGQIIGRGFEDDVNAYDLTIDADGYVNITGLIDCSGRDGLDSFDIGDPRGAGGDGAEIYISSALLSGIAAAPHIYISGRVLANGGETYARTISDGIPGNGGQILIGTGGSITIPGKISARAGQAYTAISTAVGGEVQLVAGEGLEMFNVRELTANGGSTSGLSAGDGGSITMEAPVGTIRMENFDIENRGGDCTFLAGGTAGKGGSVTFSGDAIDLRNVIVTSSGGDAVGDPSIDRDELQGDAGGLGGDAGPVNLTAASALDVDIRGLILAEGGRSNQGNFSGGTGGDVSVINLDELNLLNVDFQGAISVAGGPSANGRRGEDGVVCERGADLITAVMLTGTNDFPISICPTASLEGVPVHELDCDPATIIPESVQTELPAIAGFDVYRLRVTPTATSVTITVQGEPSGQIDLYVGDDGDLGNTNIGVYELSSTNAGSEESIEIDLTAPPFAPGQFFSILVIETGVFVESYTIEASCQEP